jgi:hypothetical protein
LTIARGLPRTHGGDLTAASPGLGRGTTFSAQFTKDVPIHNLPRSTYKPGACTPRTLPPCMGRRYDRARAEAGAGGR